MLNFMRRQSTRLRWVWVLLIFIFSVTLITLYIPIGDLGSVSLSSDVASVGGEKISAKEFQTSYRTYIDRMRSQLSPEMLNPASSSTAIGPPIACSGVRPKPITSRTTMGAL